MAELGRLTGRSARVLGASIVLLEFAAAVSTFVTQTLLPVIVTSLHATSGVGVLVSGSTVGLFVAMPLAAYLLSLLGSRATLMVGMVVTVLGGVIAATAGEVWVFAGGRFLAGFASGVLGVFGVSAAVKHLTEDIRKVVIAWSSAMWILPGLVGPAMIVGLEHVIGWRWTLLTPIPLILGARTMITKTVPHRRPAAIQRPVVRTLLIPAGVVGFLLAGTNLLGWASLTIAGVGFIGLMPPGTVSMHKGSPAGLLSLTLFAVGYFGSGSVITLLFTTTYHVPLAQAGVALGAASVGWAIASVLLTRWERNHRPVPPELALLVTAGCVAGTGLLGPTGASFLLGAALWLVAGVGVGLFYPTVYVAATTPMGRLTEEQVASAAISTEAFGGLIGGAVGGVLIGSAHLEASDFVTAYFLFTGALVLGAIAARRASPRST